MGCQQQQRLATAAFAGHCDCASLSLCHFDTSSSDKVHKAHKFVALRATLTLISGCQRAAKGQMPLILIIKQASSSQRQQQWHIYIYIYIYIQLLMCVNCRKMRRHLQKQQQEQQNSTTAAVNDSATTSVRGKASEWNIFPYSIKFKRIYTFVEIK